MRLQIADHELAQPGSRKPHALLCTKAHLSLLGGGGGGLGISGSASTSARSGAPVTVYNGTSGPLTQNTWLIIGGIALVGLLIIGLLFRGRRP